MKRDRFLAAHVRYYMREMRIAAYTQLLDSYSSLRLQYMADTFGVSLEFIEKYRYLVSNFLFLPLFPNLHSFLEIPCI